MHTSGFRFVTPWEISTDACSKDGQDSSFHRIQLLSCNIDKFKSSWYDLPESCIRSRSFEALFLDSKIQFSNSSGKVKVYVTNRDLVEFCLLSKYCFMSSWFFFDCFFRKWQIIIICDKICFLKVESLSYFIMSCLAVGHILSPCFPKLPLTGISFSKSGTLEKSTPPIILTALV